MSSQSSPKSLKRDVTEILIIDESQTESPQSSQISFQSPPPKKKRKYTAATPILSSVTPSPVKHHHHRHHNTDPKIPIIRCKSGHQMRKTKLKTTLNKPTNIECASCHTQIKANQDYFHCPKNNAKSDSLCVTCFDKEKTDYTGAITLGQKVRIKIEKEWELGSILKHWPEDDTYTIQIDGTKRTDAEAYDIYDAFWEVSFVHSNQLKPTPTRILTKCDTDSPFLRKKRTVPRCESGRRMLEMDARSIYDDSKEMSESDNGIFCNNCQAFIPKGTVYHCPNESSHSDGYDLCLKCAMKKMKFAPTLESYDLKGIAQFILSGKCKRIGILCGAGISRSAGIPDFRSKDGIYQSLKSDLAKNVLKYSLTLQQKTAIERDAQYVFSIDLFKENPTVLYHVLGDILNKRCKPTLTHCFFKLLQNKGFLKHLFTQNVDGLETYIGIDPKFLTQVHGTFLSAACFKCGAEYSIEQLRNNVANMDIPIKCSNKKCDKGFVKPDCVLFGQDLPQKYYDRIAMFDQNKEAMIDLLIVLGTSLSVKPISNLPNQINQNAVRCVFNLELNQEIKDIFEFDRVENKRDIFVGGKCDETVRELCNMLKWDGDLNKIYSDSNTLGDKIVQKLEQKQKMI